MGGKTVTFTGSTQPMYWNYDSSTSKLWLQLPVYSGGIPFTFKISGDGTCQDKYLLFFSYLSSTSLTYEVSPNPVTDVLTINVSLSQDDIVQKGVERSVSEIEFETSLYDMSNGSLVDQPRSFRGSLKQDIDFSSLKSGIYILRIRQGEEIKMIKFIKE